jgi:magnesium transporter
MTHNTNKVIKVLTMLSVIMLPLTVITGYYGMNIVGLPLANHWLAPAIVILFLVLVVVIMLVFFKWKRWL